MSSRSNAQTKLEALVRLKLIDFVTIALIISIFQVSNVVKDEFSTQAQLTFAERRI